MVSWYCSKGRSDLGVGERTCRTLLGSQSHVLLFNCMIIDDVRFGLSIRFFFSRGSHHRLLHVFISPSCLSWQLGKNQWPCSNYEKNNGHLHRNINLNSTPLRNFQIALFHKNTNLHSSLLQSIFLIPCVKYELPESLTGL